MRLKGIVSIVRIDLKNIFRDSVMAAMFFVPLIILAIIRLGVPALAEYVPGVNEYARYIVALFASLVGLFPAFLMAFVMMDEKDGYVNQVIRVIPFNISGLMLVRVLFMLTISITNCMVILMCNGLTILPVLKALTLAVDFALFAPLATLAIVTLASNKIEAMALLKGVSFVLIIGAIQFLVAGPWKYLLGIVPVFWPFRSFDANADTATFYLTSAAGIAYQLALIWILFRTFLKKW